METRLVTATLLLLPVWVLSGASAAQEQDLPPVFNAASSGTQVIPPVDTDRAAIARAAFDPGYTELELSFEISGEPLVTGARLACALPGEEGPAVLTLLNGGPLFEVTDGTVVTVTVDDLHAADCVPVIGRTINNLAALAFAMREGLIYVILDTVRFPGGELRGQFLPESETGDLDLPAGDIAFPFSP